MKLVAALITAALLSGCLPAPAPAPKHQGQAVVHQDLKVRYMNDGEGTYLRQVCWKGLVFLSSTNTMVQVMRPDGKPMTCDE